MATTLRNDPLAGAGAVSGGFLGSLIGLIFLNPLLGFAMGAAAGAVAVADVKKIEGRSR